MSETLSRRRLLQGARAAALAGLAPLGPALAAPAAAPVKIANASGALNQTLTVLIKQQRFLESFGLEPELLNVADGSKIMGGVISGSVDAAMASGFGQLFPAVERGAGLKVIGGGAVLPTLALFTGKPYVNSLKDLEGRTIAAGSVGALTYQLIVTLLRKRGVDTSKIKFVNVGSSADAFRAAAAGTVDAAPGAGALIPEADSYHVKFIPGTNLAIELADYTYQGAWTSDRMIATHRDVLVRTLAAYAKLYRFIQSPQNKAAFIVARRETFPNEQQADHEAEWAYVQTYKPFAVNLVLSPERLRYMQQLNISFQIQKTVLPFERVADMSLARDALKLLG